MEGLGVMLFADIYRGRRVLITGHTGFKGSWLKLWLKELGADVSVIWLNPVTQENHWDLLKLDAADHRQDIRDVTKVQTLEIDSAIENKLLITVAPDGYLRRV